MLNFDEGAEVDVVEGLTDGTMLFPSVGVIVGFTVGARVGVSVGFPVGANVGV